MSLLQLPAVLLAALLGAAYTSPVRAAVAAYAEPRPFPPPGGPARLGPVPAAALPALLAVLAYARTAPAGRIPPPLLAALLLLTVLGAALAAVDNAAYRLPDALVLPAYPLVVLTLTLGPQPDLARALLASALTAAGYGLLHALRPAALGFGDVKLAALIALPLGALSWRAVAYATVIALLAGAAAAALTRRAHIPYGPPLLIGAYAAAVTC